METIYKALTLAVPTTALTPSPSPVCGRGEPNAYANKTPMLRNSCVRVFILAKNEARNIRKCLEPLEKLGLQATLLDSSSTDDTVSVASNYLLVSVTKYDYSSHCRAYNEICTQLNGGAEYVMILDADMVVTEELWEEVKALISQSKVEVIKAPVLMHVEGHPLEFGSLCPPKAFVLKSGREYFSPLGHGEALVPGCAIAQTKAKLIHDDRKAYQDYLNSQYRYAQGLLGRAKSHSLSWKDRLRIGSPIMIFVTPFFSYFIKLGFMSGKAALLYALDRLIAEAVMFRQSLAERLNEKYK